MILSFQTRELLEQCSNLEKAEKWLGPPVAQFLIATLADIEALEDVSELMNFYEIDASAARDDSLSLPIGPDYRATFAAVGARLARLGDGSPDWAKVQRLKLVEILRC